MQRIVAILQNYLSHIKMPNLRWTDIVEILILAYLIYHILLWIKNTRAWSLLKGLLVVVAFVIVAAVFNMSTILWIVQHVTGLAVTAIVILLQPELRSAMEELGQTKILSSLFIFDNPRTSDGLFSDKTISEIVRASVQMARVKTGALIVIEQTSPLQEFEQDGQGPRNKAQGRRRHLGAHGLPDDHRLGGDGRGQPCLQGSARPECHPGRAQGEAGDNAEQGDSGGQICKTSLQKGERKG